MRIYFNKNRTKLYDCYSCKKDCKTAFVRPTEFKANRLADRVLTRQGIDILKEIYGSQIGLGSIFGEDFTCVLPKGLKSISRVTKVY